MTELLTDAEISEAFKGTNFGANPDFRDILAYWVLTRALTDCRVGRTLTVVMRELGLTFGDGPNPSYDDAPTAKGKAFCFDYFYRKTKT